MDEFRDPYTDESYTSYRDFQMPDNELYVYCALRKCVQRVKVEKRSTAKTKRRIKFLVGNDESKLEEAVSGREFCHADCLNYLKSKASEKRVKDSGYAKYEMRILLNRTRKHTFCGEGAECIECALPANHTIHVSEDLLHIRGS